VVKYIKLQLPYISKPVIKVYHGMSSVTFYIAFMFIILFTNTTVYRAMKKNFPRMKEGNIESLKSFQAVF